MTKITLLKNTMFNRIRYVAGEVLELEEEVAKHFVEAKLGYQPEDAESSENTEQTEETEGEVAGEEETQTEETEEVEETAEVEETVEEKATTAKNGNKKGKK